MSISSDFLSVYLVYQQPNLQSARFWSWSKSASAFRTAFRIISIASQGKSLSAGLQKKLQSDLANILHNGKIDILALAEVCGLWLPF